MLVVCRDSCVAFDASTVLFVLLDRGLFNCIIVHCVTKGCVYLFSALSIYGTDVLRGFAVMAAKA